MNVEWYKRMKKDEKRKEKWFNFLFIYFYYIFKTLNYTSIDRFSKITYYHIPLFNTQ